MERVLIQVDNNGHPRQDEQRRHHQKLFGITEGMKQQSEQSEQEWQVVETVVAFVLKLLARQSILIAQSFCIDGLNAAEPVAVQEVSVALNVILSAYKIPQEVAEVHPTHLIVLEVP